MVPPSQSADTTGVDRTGPGPLPLHAWPLSRWTDQPSARPRRRPTYEIAVVGLLLVWNVANNVFVPDAATVPVNLVAIALLLAVARRGEVSWDYLGLQSKSLGTGVRVGAAATAIVSTAIGLLAVIPASREYLADDRFIGVGVAEMLYETLIRIPIGTVLTEELAFRGVVLGMFLLWMSPLKALVASSALFGLWHVLPAIEALETNPAADLASGTVATVVEVAVQVIVTGLAGAGFAWIRFRAGSVLAPALTHWGLNSVAYLAGWMVVRNAWA